MHIRVVVFVVLSILVLTFASVTPNRLNRRDSLVIVEESERVNNTTDRHLGSINALRGASQAIDAALQAFKDDSDNLVMTVLRSAENIKVAQDKVTEYEADKVTVLRRSHFSKVLKITELLLDLKDIFKAKDSLQSVIVRLEQQQSANRVFAQIVIQKILAKHKSALIQWDEETQLAYNLAIRTFRAMTSLWPPNVE